MNYRELAEQFFKKSHEMKKIQHHKMLDECLQGEAFTLLYLREKNGFALPSEISEEMVISSARVASILNNLEKKALITREIDQSDRRKILVKLTKSGRLQVEKDHQLMISQIAAMLECLGEEDAKNFVRITSKIVEIAPEFSNRITN